ncbi:hypothetical protein SCACP_20990 [Sporomusa carbonis]|uniref:hypothetical protein n=1 Tax=Sporomusa carbonis TaxID=3076075 RepID=UPI003A6C448F
MFGQLAAGDTRLIVRGLLILLAIVTIGVGVAEHQLATLTQRHEQGRFFYIGRNQEHVYSAYIFGYGITFSRVYLLGNISRTDHNIVLNIGDHAAVIPVKLEIDTSRLRYWLDVWRRQFVKEALTVRNDIITYWNQAKPYAGTAFEYLKNKSQNVMQQMVEYIHEYR